MYCRNLPVDPYIHACVQYIVFSPKVWLDLHVQTVISSGTLGTNLAESRTEMIGNDSEPADPGMNRLAYRRIAQQAAYTV